jgi:DNA-binding transcriptional LysR family regulator
MNLRRLRFFLGVAAEGSLTRAARSYGVAQPALSRQMHLLEEELRAKLFERSPRGLRLTETGQFLKDALEAPLTEIEAALRSVRSFSTHVSASLTMGLPPSVSTLIGGRLVDRMRRELPNIALRIVEADSSKLAADLARRLIDTAILVSVVPEQRVSRAPVLSEPLYLVGTPEACAPYASQVQPRALEQAPLILPSEQSGVRINLSRYAETVGIKIVPAMEIDSVELTKQLLAGSAYCTILPERCMRDDVAKGVLAKLPIVDPPLTQEVFWAVKPDWRHPRVVYNELERIVFDEWYEAVTSGDWPAEWVFDFSVLSIPFRRSISTPLS